MANEETTILQMHDLKPAPGARKDRIRVGRGEGSKGKTSGRGDKGTKKRYQVRPGFEGGHCTCVFPSSAASAARSRPNIRL